MRFDKLTAKFQAALQDAQSAALAGDCGFIEAVHLMHALLQDNDSSVASVLAHSGANVSQIKQEIDK